MTHTKVVDKSYLLDPAFELCLVTALDTDGLIKEFDRLYGTNLSLKGAPIVLMVEEATGKRKEDMGKFVDFVRDYVYFPMSNKFLEETKNEFAEMYVEE